MVLTIPAFPKLRRTPGEDTGPEKDESAFAGQQLSHQIGQWDQGHIVSVQRGVHPRAHSGHSPEKGIQGEDVIWKCLPVLGK